MGFADGDFTEKGRNEAEIACVENVDCVGISCATEDGPCTVRKGPTLIDSSNNEVSFTKSCGKHIVLSLNTVHPICLPTIEFELLFFFDFEI